MSERGPRLYVYYRVHEDRLPAVMQAVTGWQRDLRGRHPGLRTELLRRPEVQDGHCTLMEVYRHDGDAGVDPALQARVEAEARQRLDGLGTSERHVEVFLPCAS